MEEVIKLLYITDIMTHNIKSHEDVHIRLPQSGIVRFKGPNNAGKSVIPDLLYEIIACKLHILRDRRPYVSKWADEGYMRIIRNDGAELLVNVHKESAKTFYRLSLPGQEIITRYIADKNLRELISLFGFHWNEEREMSLNLHKTFDPVLYITTSERYNYDILNSVITDPVTEDALKYIQETYKGFDDARKQLVARIDERQNFIAGMEFCEEEVLEQKKLILQKLSKLIKALTTHDVFDEKPEIDISVIEKMDTSSAYNALSGFVHTEVKYYDAIEILLDLPRWTDFSEEIESYIKLVDAYDNGICATCGRLYKDDECAKGDNNAR